MSEACTSEAQEAATPRRYPGWQPGYGKGFRGGPGRTSPLRQPCAMVPTAAVAEVAAAVIAAGAGAAPKGSRFEKARPRTRISAVHSAIAMPAQLKGVLFEITEKADLDTCEAQFFSYGDLAHRLGCDRRTAIAWVARLQSFGVMRPERQSRKTDAGKVYHLPCKMVLQIPPWLEPPAASAPLPPETSTSSSSTSSSSTSASPIVNNEPRPPASSSSTSASPTVNDEPQPPASSPAALPPAPPPLPPEQVERVRVALSAAAAEAEDGERWLSAGGVRFVLELAHQKGKNLPTLVNAINYVTKRAQIETISTCAKLRKGELGALLLRFVPLEDHVDEPEQAAQIVASAVAALKAPKPPKPPALPEVSAQAWKETWRELGFLPAIDPTDEDRAALEQLRARPPP